MGELKSIRKSKLTPTDVKVVKAKIKAELTDKSQAQVAQEVFPNQTPGAASVSMTRTLKKANVQDELALAFANLGLDASSLAGVVVDGMKANRVVQVEGDFYETEVADHGIRLKAVGLAARWMGVEKAAENGTTNYNFINVSKADKDEYAV